MVLLIIMITTTSISLYIKSIAQSLAIRDLAKKGITMNKNDFELKSVLNRKLIKVKNIHYLIPFDNIIVSLLYVSSYFIIRKEIIKEIQNNNVEYKPKELNNEDKNQIATQENIQINDYDKKRNDLLKIRKELTELKGPSLKRKK